MRRRPGPRGQARLQARGPPHLSPCPRVPVPIPLTQWDPIPLDLQSWPAGLWVKEGGPRWGDRCPQLLPGPEKGARAPEGKAWGQGNGMRGLGNPKTVDPRAVVVGRGLRAGGRVWGSSRQERGWGVGRGEQ